MRTPLTIAFAVLAGVHCSAPVYSDSGERASTDEVVTQEPTPAPRAGTTSSDEKADSDDPGWGVEAEGLPETLFTTTVRGEDGALYAAGTFSGWLPVGGDMLKSKGANDVVLVRFDESGRITWVKSIGSNREERGPKVTFVDGTVRLLAETEGQVDCGSGEMGKWSSGMFFYCLYGTDGAALGGGTFPTGAP
jgi:hypothetical protein